jgi:DNA-binding CsgD family transcriptional regulator
MDGTASTSELTPIDLARQLFVEARYGQLLRVLDAGIGGPHRFEAALLRARALLRLQRPSEAAAVLENIGDGNDLDERTSALMLRGAALHRTGRVSEAWGALHRARSLAAAARPETSAEAAFHVARAHWRERRLDDAERALADALDPSAQIVHTHALELMGLIAVQRERHADAVVAFKKALVALSETRRRDDDLRGTLIQALCAIAYDTGDVALAHEMRQTLAETATDAIAPRSRVAAVLSLGMCALAEGAYDRAWDDLLEALRSERPIDVVRAGLGFADLYDLRGDVFSRARHFAHARDLARAIDFEESPVEDRLVLLDVAAHAARFDEVASARAALDVFERLDTRDRTTSADRRLDAMRWYANGLIAEGEGRRDEGIVLLDQSIAGWNAIGCTRRAANVRAARAAVADASASIDLTPAERRVMLAICKGLRAREIAVAFGRSENTIKNQTRRLFERMGVRNRAELVAKSAQLGMLGSAGADAVF